MKRWFLMAVLLISVLIIGVFILMPTKKQLSHSVTLRSAAPAVSRLLLSNNWRTWWPGKAAETGNLHEYEGYRYRINKTLLNSVHATVLHGTDSLAGSLAALPDGDSAKFTWRSNVRFSTNPFRRVQQYYTLSKFEQNINSLLAALQDFFAETKNVYGAAVQLVPVHETPLMALTAEFAHYPSTNEIYTLIDSLRRFIVRNNAQAVNAPMMNVHTDDSTRYTLRVAFQTSREIPPAGRFQAKRLVMGKMLTMDVQGGPATILQQQQQLVNYMHDHNKTSPAIPYQLLITDRSSQPDTAKWITRLHYPVF